MSKHGNRGYVPAIASYLLCFKSQQALIDRRDGPPLEVVQRVVKIHVFPFGFGRLGAFLADLQVKTRNCHSTHGIFKKVCYRAVSNGESPT